MTETTTATTKAKTAKHVASSFGLPDYGIPNFEIPKFDMSFDMSNVEMPEAFRSETLDPQRTAFETTISFTIRPTF